MTYSMKTINIHSLMGVLLLAGIMLTGCTKDNTMDEIVKPAEQEKTTDDFIKALKAIDGVRNVEAKTTASGEETVYYFYFRQPINHANPDAGTFDQQVAISFKGYDKDVVLHTHGYTIYDISNFYRDDLSTHLGANQVNVEHRYFGNSLPEPADSPSYTYFNAEQEAYDLHAIVQILKKNLFKTGKWASTGTSKDGITSALYAYYSDQNGWNDIDLFVPFCAPFLPGSTAADGTFTCMDTRIGNYQDQVCGTGYAAGSLEAIACQRLHDIPYYICTNKTLRNACNKYTLASDPTSYRKILDQYNQHSPMSTGDLEKDITALTISTYVGNLFSKFSYVQFPLWVKLVPDPAKAITDEKELGNLLTFITMDHEILVDSLKVLNGANVDDDTEETETRSALDVLSVLNDRYSRFWKYINDLRGDNSYPYLIQAFKELGASEYAFLHVDGTFLTPTQVRDVNEIFSVQHQFSGIFRQDEGALMRNFRQWVATESTQNIVFVYAHNDPWTGGRPDETAISQNPKTVMVIDPISVHNDFFLNSSYYTPQTKKVIVDAVNKYMK